MEVELEATARPIPFWFYRVVAGAAEPWGQLRRRRAYNNTVRGTSLCALRARGGAERRGESGPSFGPGRRRFLFYLIDGGERWRAASVAAALELGGRLRQHPDRSSTDMVGSETTRFFRFVASPRAAARHLACVLRREPDRQAGHNAAGGWMVLLLLVLLLGETLSGLYVANDVADEGPLTELTPVPIANTITALHWIFWDALLAAVALHLLAILVYAAVKGHNLLLPMITGWKTLPASVPQPRVAGLCARSFLSAAARSP